jgi:hypothetical protein
VEALSVDLGKAGDLSRGLKNVSKYLKKFQTVLTSGINMGLVTVSTSLKKTLSEKEKNKMDA